MTEKEKIGFLKQIQSFGIEFVVTLAQWEALQSAFEVIYPGCTFILREDEEKRDYAGPVIGVAVKEWVQ